ncbi:MAG: chemotaxis protein CheW [Treponema sp.]|nr:chemotaxis protein CheW [Treponema sp.]
MKFIILANFVDTILLIKKSEIITVIDRPEIKLEGRIIKLFYLSQILQIKPDSAAENDDAIFIVIIKAYYDLLALAVDNILQHEKCHFKKRTGIYEKHE